MQETKLGVCTNVVLAILAIVAKKIRGFTDELDLGAHRSPAPVYFKYNSLEDARCDG